MLEIRGQYNTALVYSDEGIEPEAYSQVQTFVNHIAFKDARIRFMPDIHAGKGVPIGFTAELPLKDIHVIANVIGVDIGCSVLMVNLGPSFVDPLKAFTLRSGAFSFQTLDEFIRASIPFGSEVRTHSTNTKILESAIKMEGLLPKGWFGEMNRIVNETNQSSAYVWSSIGTLGGGNHFIELDLSEKGELWLAIHSGSRNFGLKVCNFYQKLARTTIEKDKMVEELDRIKKTFKGKDIEREVKAARHKLGLGIPRQLEWLEGANAQAYITAMQFAQSFARVSRLVMAADILEFLGLDITKQEIVESVHNYMEVTKDKAIIRKGAISAKTGQKCVIPMNMADGVLMCVGKGNYEWNQSAPHGAGRIIARKAAKKPESEGGLNLEAYQKIMADRGIWTSCVSQDTLDEAPQAYKPTETIIKAIGDTVDILEVMKPVYNFKASE